MSISGISGGFDFDCYDLLRLSKALKQVKDKRSYVRLRAVLLVAQGHELPSVCTLLECSRATLYRWVGRYLKAHDPADLFDAPRQGRPRSAEAITDRRILKELQRSPLQLGYGLTTWTVAALAQHLTQRYRCAITPATLYRRMKAIGLEYKRPKYFYEEKALHRAQKKGLSSES